MTKAMSLISPYCGAADPQYFYDNYVLTLMKRAVIYIVMSLCILGAKAQNLINADDKLVHFGFNVGINVMDFGIKSSMTPIDGKIYQSEVSSLTPGFSVGVIGDLRLHKVDRVTIGQYLAPSKAHLPVRRYVSPQNFDLWRQRALEMGFKTAHAGVFVRSSYHASDDSLKAQ